MNQSLTTVLAVLTEPQLVELSGKAIDTADRDLLTALHEEHLRRANAEADEANARMRAEVAQ